MGTIKPKAKIQASVDHVAIYRELKGMLAKHVPPFVARGTDRGAKPEFHLWSEQETVIDGRTRPELYYAGVIVQSTYVGFYYMCVYMNPALMKTMSPALRKMLKGKACFHIVKPLTPALSKEIKALIVNGARYYKKQKWV